MAGELGWLFFVEPLWKREQPDVSRITWMAEVWQLVNC